MADALARTVDMIHVWIQIKSEIKQMMKCIKALAPLFGMLLAAPCMAQPRWEILMGEDYGPQQTLPVADPWKTDRSLACAQCTDHGFIVNGTFIGMVPVGLDPDKIPENGWRQHYLDSRPVPRDGSSRPLWERQPMDTIVNGQRVSLLGVWEARTEQPVLWLTLEQVRAKYLPQVKGKCAYTIDKFIIPGNDSLYRIDADYIYRVEAMKSTCIHALADQPPFTFVRIFTRAFDRRLACMGEPGRTHPRQEPIEERRNWNASLFVCTIPNRMMKYYTSLSCPPPGELYQGQNLQDFLSLCEGMDKRVTGFLSKQERRRLARTGETRPYLELCVSSEGEVLQARLSSPRSILQAMSQSRFRALDSTIKSIHFPAFNRQHSPWEWDGRCINVGFRLME